MSTWAPLSNSSFSKGTKMMLHLIRTVKKKLNKNIKEHNMKRKMIKLATFVTVLFIPIILTTAAFAQGYGHMRGQMRGHMMYGGHKMPEIMGRIGLSEEQNRTILNHCDRGRNERTGIQSKIRDKRMELKYELEKKEIDREAIDRTVQDLKNLYAEMLEHRVNQILKLRSTLTPEQFEQLQYMQREQQPQERRRGFGQRGRLLD